MKLLVLTFFISTTVQAFVGHCQAPGQAFLANKLKESFGTAPAEKELKEVVLHAKNYELREEIKSLDRRSKVADRIMMKEISLNRNQKFAEMIEKTGRTEELTDFPVTGAISKLGSTEDALEIEVKNLSKEDLDIIPKPVLDKLGNNVRIQYKYPYDRFDYILTYDGKELPMDKALNKVQNDLEDACEQRMADNQHSRDLWDKDREIRKFKPLDRDKKGSSGQ